MLFELLREGAKPPRMLDLILSKTQFDWGRVMIRRTREKISWQGSLALVLGDLHTVTVDHLELDPADHPVLAEQTLHPYLVYSSRQGTYTLTSNGGWVTVVTPHRKTKQPLP